MMNLEDELKRILANFNSDDNEVYNAMAALKICIANFEQETVNYFSSDEVRQELVSASSLEDVVNIANDTVNYAIESFRKTYDQRPEFNVIREKEEVKEILAGTLGLAFKLMVCNKKLGYYLEEKLAFNPLQTKDEAKQIIKEVFNEFFDLADVDEKTKRYQEQITRCALEDMDSKWDSAYEKR